ncbi:MAG TPA: TetR/AcrR family transcriptional regulator [Actinocrinis sp.]|jgi:AcrR family transcriptional regulator
MPKVSAQYRDARREQILDAARRCFLRNGFHETSMQDLFAEAGLSSGAFYRYFAGKDELILAIAQENFRDVLAALSTLVQEGEASLGDAIARAVDLIDAKHADEGIGSLAVQVWAESLRNPELAARFAGLLQELHDQLAEVVRRHQAAGELPADISAKALTSVIVGTVPGHVVQLVLLGPDAVAGSPDALRALWPKPAASDPALSNGGRAGSAADRERGMPNHSGTDPVRG